MLCLREELADRLRLSGRDILDTERLHLFSRATLWRRSLPSLPLSHKVHVLTLLLRACLSSPSAEPDRRMGVLFFPSTRRSFEKENEATPGMALLSSAGNPSVLCLPWSLARPSVTATGTHTCTQISEIACWPQIRPSSSCETTNAVILVLPTHCG